MSTRCEKTWSLTSTLPKIRASLVSFLGKVPIVSTSLRWLARRYSEGSIVTIRNGYLSGYKWIRSHRYVNGYWLGIYELPIQICLSRELHPGDIFYDLGANAGFFSLLGSKLVKTEGHVYIFEPLPSSVETIKQQIAINDVTNCTLVEAAVTDSMGSIPFEEGSDSSCARIRVEEVDKSNAASGASFQVKTLTLDQFLEEHRPPDFIKMDIEGAEILALRGAATLINGDRPPKFLIELHGPDLAIQACEMLKNAGYALFDLERKALEPPKIPRHVLALPIQR